MNLDNQIYILFQQSSNISLKPRPNLILIENSFLGAAKFLTYLPSIIHCRKLFLHGLFLKKIQWLIAIQPWLWGKTYWIAWGGDIYKPSSQVGIPTLISSIAKNITARHIKNIVSLVPGDYEVIRNIYNNTGAFHQCITYPSNIPGNTAPTPAPLDNRKLIILAGNSADPSNNHGEIFEKLAPMQHNISRIYCPLSYGSPKNASAVAAEGTRIFGEKFIPLESFIDIQAYIDILSEVNIAVFAHRRQQALGNTINLLSMGKVVYMQTTTTTYRFLKDIGLQVGDISKLSLFDNRAFCTEGNQQIVKKYFSKSKLKTQLSALLSSK